MFSFMKNIFNGTLHKVCKRGDIEAVKQFLADGADVNVKNGKGVLLLYNSGWEDRKEIAELLVAGGADVNAKDRYSQTPLDSAISLKHAEITDLLRKHGGKTSKELKAEEK